jgi:cytochrome c peroxidase
VVRHYSEVNEERLHGMDGQRLIRPLRLTSEETADLVAFLETLSGEVLVER